MTKCSFCWKPISGSPITMQPDNIYIFNKDSKVCLRCFNAIASDNWELIRPILKEKFILARTQSGVKAAHRPHEAKDSKFDSSDCDNTPDLRADSSASEKDRDKTYGLNAMNTQRKLTPSSEYSIKKVGEIRA